MLDKTFELGERFWDSADAYNDNEELIGKWFAKTGNRDKVFLATKFAVFVNPDGSRTIRGDAPYVKEACEKSLKRLGIDTIDLYYAHRYVYLLAYSNVLFFCLWAVGCGWC